MWPTVLLLVCCFCCWQVVHAGKLSDFNQWFQSVTSPRSRGKVKASRKGVQFGVGLVAVTDIREGDVVVDVSMDDVICQATMENMPGPVGALMRKAFTAFAKHIPRGDKLAPALAMAVILLRNAPRATGFKALSAEDQARAAHFDAWLSALPKRFNGGLYIGKMLQEKLVVDQALRQSIEQSQRELKSALQVALQVVDDVNGHDLFDAVPLTVATFRWALSAINSRAWSLSGKKFLVPMADFFNFAPHGSQMLSSYRYKARGDLFSETHKVESSASGARLVVLADRDAAAGTELYETYGDNSNNIYLVYHGFVPDVNPSHCVNVDLPWSNDRQRRQQRQSLLQRMGVPLRARQYCLRGKRFLQRSGDSKRGDQQTQGSAAWNAEVDKSAVFAFERWLVDYVYAMSASDEDVTAYADGSKQPLWRSPQMLETNSKFVVAKLQPSIVSKLRVLQSVDVEQVPPTMAVPRVVDLVVAYNEAATTLLEEWVVAPPNVDELQKRKANKEEL